MLLSANANIRKIEKLKELGYDAIDVGFTRVIYHNDPYPHEDILDSEDWEKNLDPYIAKAKEVGIKIATTHLPYRYDYTDTESEKFAYCHPLTVRSLQASEYLGAEWAVMHVSTVEGTVEYVKRLFAESGVKNIGLAIENMAKRPINELIEVVDILAAEGYKVGICLDIGHAHINKFFDNNVPDVIAAMGKRIKMLHVHDNNRATDMHKAPFMGTAPWADIMKALKDAGYEGEFNFELQPENIPDPVARETYEKYSVDISKYLIGLFNQA
ncbi:MAG: sugar phosphate isomerase/epimerase [Clostridia bacterium]|nr:sugar phosphate isomerase/epimerase [Clostridia bacterium]